MSVPFVHPIRPRRSRAARSGFTLVELVLACLIVTLIIGGVVTTLRMVLAVQAGATARWNDDAEASAAADELAAAVAAAVDLPSSPGIRSGQGDGGNASELLCTVAVGHGLEKRRYAWGPAAAAGVASAGNSQTPGDSEKLALSVQSLRFAGEQNLSLLPGARVPEPQQLFDAVAPTLIARRLDRAEITYRAAGSASTDWKTSWAGPAAGVLVRVRIQVGAITVERVAKPVVSAPLAPQKKEDQS